MCLGACVLVVSLQELSANQELSILNNLTEVSLICVEVFKKRNGIKIETHRLTPTRALELC